MLIRFTILFLTLFTCTDYAFGQKTTEFEDPTLVFEFSPAFIEKSTLIFHHGTRKPFAELIVFEKESTQKVRHKERLNLQSDSLTKLIDSFKNYKFSVKGNEDTIGIEKHLGKNGDTVVSYIVNEGLDGVTVSGALTQGTRARKFAFWSPQEGTDNYKLMHTVFAIINSGIKEQESITYIKALQRYFQ